jgi:energy-coupling factor transport system permease protein
VNASGTTLFPAFRPRASALHAASAGVGAAFCGALALVFVVFSHPLVVAAALVAVIVASGRAGVGDELARAARLGAAVALFVLLLNPLLSNEGATLLIRGWTILDHHFDITLEAVAFGAIAGLRLLGLILACALFSAAVDPDDLLGGLRRFSYRSALTAALTTRLVPVLARDASRRGEAARCRLRSPGRIALARAALAGSLERAVDVAAALEVRGYGSGVTAASGRRFAGRVAGRRSRHDLRFALCAAALVLVVVAGALAGVAQFAPYPRLELATDPATLGLSAVLIVLATAPFRGPGAHLGIGRGDN